MPVNGRDLVVAFTTHGERARVIDPVVENHIRLARRVGAEVRLYVQPETMELLAPEILARRRPGEFSIKTVEQDYGPVTKYLGPALDDEIARLPVIVVDDDILYSDNCFSQLYETHRTHPGCVVANVARVIPFSKDGPDPKTGVRSLDPRITRFTRIPRLLYSDLSDSDYRVHVDQFYFVEHCGGVLYPGEARVAPPLFRAMAQSFFGRQDDLLVSALMVSRRTLLCQVKGKRFIQSRGIPGNERVGEATSLFRKTDNGQVWMSLLRELLPFFDQKASFWS